MTKKIKVKEDMKQVQLDLFTQVEIKIENSTNLLEDMRVSPFLPLIKLSEKSPTFKKFVENKNISERQTAWGKILIRNRLLTQVHKDILHAIYVLSTVHKTKRLDNEKRMVMTFNRYELLKKLNMGHSGTSYKRLDKWIKEIKDCVIERTFNDNKDSISFNIIDDLIKNDDYYGVVLSRNYSKRFATEMTINITNRFDEIVAIKGEGAGPIKSIIEHFLTHQANEDNKVHIKLDKMINIINYPVYTVKQISVLKKTLLTYEKELGKFGITFDKTNTCFTYIGANDIKMYPTLELLEKREKEKKA